MYWFTSTTAIFAEDKLVSSSSSPIPPIQKYQDVAFLRCPSTDDLSTYGIWAHLFAEFSQEVGVSIPLADLGQHRAYQLLFFRGFGRGLLLTQLLRDCLSPWRFWLAYQDCFLRRPDVQTTILRWRSLTLGTIGLIFLLFISYIPR